MMKKTVIIGGGVAGLSVGIFLQKRGFPTVIYEKNSVPGGIALPLTVDGFRFDFSCRCLNGIAVGRRHNLMLESGALYPRIPFACSSPEIYENEGEVFRVEWNIESFRSLLFRLASPADARRIDRFFQTVEKFFEFSREPKERPFALLTFREKKDFLMHYRKYPIPFFKAMMTPSEKWIGEWESDSVRRLWRALYPDHYSLYAFYTYMAARLYGNSGFPKGGAGELINRLVETYRSSGGELITAAPVDEITVSNARVTGVRVGGRLIEADTVVAACNINAVLGKLLKGCLKIRPAVNLMKQGDLFYPLFTVCYGLKKQYGIPASFWLEDEKGVDGSPDLTNYRIEIHSSEGDSDTAPNGKSALVVNLRCDYFYWKNLKQKSGEAYLQYQLMVVDELNSCMERRFPGFIDSIETVRTLTPLSYEENADLHKGSWRGFAPTVYSLKNRIPRCVKGCRGLYFCGQSVAVGGGIDAVTEDAYDTAVSIETDSRR